MVDPIVVVAYDPAWPAMFAGERERLVAALRELALAIEHHGSTAVPGLAAKPILDVMVAVPDLDDVDECTSRLERAGYNRRAVGDLAGRLYFHRAEGGRRLVHLSLAERDGAFWREHLLFRDALRADAELAGRYEELKRELAVRHRDDRLAYTEAKTDFIRGALRSLMGEGPRSGWAREERR
jgi:GrpB-like predicted nucleotidyltransferase (UPF0157 family)